MDKTRNAFSMEGWHCCKPNIEAGLIWPLDCHRVHWPLREEGEDPEREEEGRGSQGAPKQTGPMTMLLTAGI